MSEIILHNYPQSPVAEKVRVSFGIKGLSWRSVEIPRIPPKPLLMPLTGGYRRTPVMQIGADVYCDSQCIMREIERRHPQPTFFPGGAQGMAWGTGGCHRRPRKRGQDRGYSGFRALNTTAGAPAAGADEEACARTPTGSVHSDTASNTRARRG